MAENIAGILTEVGGRTSHSAILARAMEIPAVLSIDGIDVYKRQPQNQTEVSSSGRFFCHTKAPYTPAHYLPCKT